jgi:DNA-binding transcriptional ArsR family regulator
MSPFRHGAPVRERRMPVAASRREHPFAYSERGAATLRSGGMELYISDRCISQYGTSMRNASRRARNPGADRTSDLNGRAAREMLSHAGEAADFLRALANEQRLLILCSLLEGRRSVGEINERVDLSQSALSQHLAVLRERKLVRTEREAQTIYYSLPEGPARRVLAVLYEVFCTG